MNTEFKIGNIVKINKPHLENEVKNGGHNYIGKIVSIGRNGYMVAVYCNGSYHCDFNSVILYNGQVSNETKNIPIPRSWR